MQFFERSVLVLCGKGNLSVLNICSYVLCGLTMFMFPLSTAGV